MPSNPGQRRDDGLRRVSRTTRWVAGCSAAAAGVFTLLAAHPKLPKLPSLRVSQTPAAPGTAGTPSGDSSGGQSTLNPPSQAPAPAVAPPQVVSGSS